MATNSVLALFGAADDCPWRETPTSSRLRKSPWFRFWGDCNDGGGRSPKGRGYKWVTKLQIRRGVKS